MKRVHCIGVLALLALLCPCQAEEPQEMESITVQSSVLMESTARVELDRTERCAARVGHACVSPPSTPAEKFFRINQCV